ncbi:MAG: hypothetical protein J7J94_04700 [Thaumarchaeota archaeon]|nr:hypothetical protein [Nitrososphaerota archaeon]
MKGLNELVLIVLLILAAFIPVIYATLVTISTWVFGLTAAWILLGAVYVSLAKIKWKR